jgi:hypothetical protein
MSISRLVRHLHEMVLNLRLTSLNFFQVVLALIKVRFFKSFTFLFAFYIKFHSGDLDVLISNMRRMCFLIILKLDISNLLNS